MRNHGYLFLVLLLATASCSKAPLAKFNITNFGTSSNAKTINTLAIQKAIDACHEAGGGNVIIPTGTWYSGSLELLSNVNLLLETGAVLKGSPNLDDYGGDRGGRGLLFAFNQKILRYPVMVRSVATVVFTTMQQGRIIQAVSIAPTREMLP